MEAEQTAGRRSRMMLTGRQHEVGDVKLGKTLYVESEEREGGEFGAGKTRTRSSRKRNGRPGSRYSQKI